MGQADPKLVLPSQQFDRENRRRGARVDGQAHGRGDDTVIAVVNRYNLLLLRLYELVTSNFFIVKPVFLCY